MAAAKNILIKNILGIAQKFFKIKVSRISGFT
jgi:hypothetical protein